MKDRSPSLVNVALFPSNLNLLKHLVNFMIHLVNDWRLNRPYNPYMPSKKSQLSPMGLRRIPMKELNASLSTNLSEKIPSLSLKPSFTKFGVKNRKC